MMYISLYVFRSCSNCLWNKADHYNPLQMEALPSYYLTIDFLIFFKLTGLGRDCFFQLLFWASQKFSKQDDKQTAHFNTRRDNDLCNSLGHILTLSVWVTGLHCNLGLFPCKH